MNTSGILKQLAVAYPNTQVSVETTAMYVRLLADIPPDELQTVVDQAVATCKFFPTIAELRDMHHNLRNANRLTWADAWENVVKEMRRIGGYGTPQFDDELTARAVKAMGWRALCVSENASTDRAQFRDMYNAMAARAESTQKLLPQAREYADRAIESKHKLLTTNGKVTA